MQYNKLFFWVENYFFNPSVFQKIVSFILLPLTAIYCLAVIIKRKNATPENLGIPVISVGNLIAGGSGKTPFTISLSKHLKNPAIILRGYKRESKGLIIVSKNGELLTTVKQSGDEAMLLAKSIPDAFVIVSEDRREGILKAKELGAKSIILDDGFSKAKIAKYDILIKPVPEPKNSFCIPSGPYREPKSFYNKADLIIKENIDFKRTVKVENQTQKMILVTAISKPSRLDPYLPKVIDKIYYPDHYHFKKEELQEILQKYQVDSIITTEKDAVKMHDFDLNLSILKLNLQINQKVIENINNFLDDFDKISKS